MWRELIKKYIHFLRWLRSKFCKNNEKILYDNTKVLYFSIRKEL